MDHPGMFQDMDLDMKCYTSSDLLVRECTDFILFVWKICFLFIHILFIKKQTTEENTFHGFLYVSVGTLYLKLCGQCCTVCIFSSKLKGLE